MNYEETKTGVVFYDDGKVVAKYFNETTGKIRVSDKGLTVRQLAYINHIIEQYHG